MSAQEMARQQFQQEHQKAIERIRTMPDGVVGWVIRFLHTDLDALTPTEWTLLAFEVVSFVDDLADRYGGIVATESGWSVEAVPQAKPFQTIPSRKEAVDIQATVLAQLENYWHDSQAVFSFPQLTLVVLAPGAFPDDSGTIIVAAKRKAKEFEYRFAHLLAQSGDYIRRCPECATIYLAIRRDQVYCHPRCQARVASRKWRETHRSKEIKVPTDKTRTKADSAVKGRKGGFDGKAKR
ncbi:MAG: hypothetical protein H0V35_05630 [Nitrospira sp.]|nr:hypothetical protein [Nitrospira sp.]